MKNRSLLNSTARRAVGRMTAAEQATGRYMRAPDDHGTGTPAPSPGPTPSPSPSATPYLPEALDDTSFASLPTNLQPLYVKGTDGKYKLDDVNHLRGVLNNVKGENATLKGKNSQYQQYAALGLEPDAIKALIEEKRLADEKKLKDEGDWNSLKQQMEANHQNELKAKQDREGKLLSTINKALVDDQARSVLADPEISGNPTLLLPLIRDRVKVTETDNGFELQVLQAEGGAPMLNSSNQPATLKDLFLEMKAKPEYAGAFKGVNQSGGGAPPSNGNGGGGGATPSRSKMTAVQKTAFIGQHGLEKYQALPA